MTRYRAIIAGVAALAGALWMSLPRTGAEPYGASPSRLLTFAVQEFVPSSSDVGDLTRELARLITKDLVIVDRLAPMEPSALVAIDPNSMDSVASPPFDVWRKTRVKVLVTGHVSRWGENLKVECYVWDVAAGLLILAERDVAPAANWRQLAHMTASAISERLTGEKRELGPGRK